MNDFWEKYYKSLEGATIQKFFMNSDEFSDEPFPAYQVRYSDGTVGVIEISRDPEGNGPGFIFGLAIPQNKEGK